MAVDPSGYFDPDNQPRRKTKGTEDMSETKQKNKIDPCIWLDDAPKKHKGWVGILFLKCGRAINGTTVYPSEEAVQKAAKNWEADTEMKRGERDDIWCGHPAAHFWYSEYSHVIAIPVKEKP